MIRRKTKTKAELMQEILADFLDAGSELQRRVVVAQFVKKVGIDAPFLFAHIEFDEFDIGIYLIDSEYAGKHILIGANCEPVEGATNIRVEDLVKFSRYAYDILSEDYDLESLNRGLVKKWKNSKRGA